MGEHGLGGVSAHISVLCYHIKEKPVLRALGAAMGKGLGSTLYSINVVMGAVNASARLNSM